MSDERTTQERILAYAAGELSGEEAALVEIWLATDAQAARLLQDYQTISAVVRADRAFAVPEALIARAKAIFQPSVSCGPSLIDRLRAVVAELTFDSRAQVALAGVRGEAVAHQLTYQAGDLDIDLQLEPIGEGDNRCWRVLGQVSSEVMPTIVGIELISANSDEAIARTTADEHAMFHCDLPAGAYDLCIHARDGSIILPGLQIP